MSTADTPEEGVLSWSTLDRIDEVADQFERAWQSSGPPPRIQDYLLDDFAIGQTLLLEELVKIDLEYRHRRGQPRPLLEYAREFPQLLGPHQTLPTELLEHETRLHRPRAPSLPPSASRDSSGTQTSLPLAIGKYRVIDALGEGAQATIYRAIDPGLNRIVAIKLSKRTIGGDPTFCAMLRAEGSALAALDHPGLLRVYECGWHEGRPFLAMEYVMGSDLETSVQHRPRTPRQAAQLVASVARALAVVHRQGILHQDLKPQNILVDETGRPRLVDFGLARLRHFWTDDADQPNGGTVAYMAPEQARGERERVGPRSDLFALGGVLYFLLTGRAPFDAENFAQALEQACRGEVDVSALRTRSIPRRLAAICGRALAADPAKRHSTAEDLAADLERFARPPWLLILLGVVVGLLAMSALVWTVWPSPLVEPPMEQQVIELVERQERGSDRIWAVRSPADLQKLMPLRQGDRLRLACNLPKGCRPAVFWLDTSGEWRERTSLQVQPGDRFDHLKEVLPVQSGRRGALFILVCANRGGKPNPTLRQVRPFLDADDLGQLPWQALSPHFVYLLQREQVLFEGEEPRGGDPLQALLQVEERLEHLRLRLRERIDYFWGVTLPLQ